MEITPHVKDVLARFVDTVLPPQSLITGSLESGGIESELWAEVKFLDEPCCYICGFPFEFDEGAEALCGRSARLMIWPAPLLNMMTIRAIWS